MKKHLHQLTGVEPEQGYDLGSSYIDEETNKDPNLADRKIPPNDVLNNEFRSASGRSGFNQRGDPMFQQADNRHDDCKEGCFE